MTIDDLKRKYEEPTAEVEEKAHKNRYSLPFGLCEGVGIDTTDMTPREAWDAYTKKTGKTKAEAEREHWGKKTDAPSSEPKTDEPKQKEIKSKADIKTKDDLISWIYFRHNVRLKNDDIPFLNANKKRLYTQIPKGSRNSILSDLKQQGFFVEEHNNGYYWIDLPKAAKRSKYNF